MDDACARPDAIRFRVLGPVEVFRHGVPVPVTADKHRALLAGLLLRANRLVTVTQLAGWLWGDEPPANARGTIQNYVARLRRSLGDRGELIRTEACGYLIRLRPDQLDLTSFDALVGAADAEGDPAAEAALLEQALGLWRGVPLSNICADGLTGIEVSELVERMLLVRERYFDARLRLGTHEALIPELRAMTEAHPLRERFRAQLIEALYRSGRRADALDAHRSVVRLLADELGIEPSAELRALHGVMITGAQPPVRVPRPRRAEISAAPAQLPSDVRGFTGRTAEIARLDALLDEGATTVAIAGTAGVGKTALAIRWGRRVADRFPDGQLWVNLRGYDLEQPLDPSRVLVRFLHALGVPGEDVPAGVVEQEALYRARLAGKRMLIVLDNASSPSQVRPLLPGSPGCTVLVTSRDEFSCLVERDGAVRLRLDVLDHAEATELLSTLLGAGPADMIALHELARLCDRLPLALRIAGDRIASSPGYSLSEMVGDLAADAPMDAFAAGDDPRTALRVVFSWSYRALPADAALLFRRLGAVPGAGFEATMFDAFVAAALLDSTPVRAQELLDALAAAHLVERRSGARFTMHDLLQAYAIEQVGIEDSPADTKAAAARLAAHYRALAQEAVFNGRNSATRSSSRTTARPAIAAHAAVTAMPPISVGTAGPVMSPSAAAQSNTALRITWGQPSGVSDAPKHRHGAVVPRRSPSTMPATNAASSNPASAKPSDPV
ncbi:hypothetical protein FKR81_19000 [Lentzea tibetensis]|uniref:OmpR/PhoB-type domain-containing protein n=1 Tax=Lentzea tibetensis TaxID=2591470 RepID=A0A563ET35_9PSEU|nr:AfsR/SARP family transcriptional regulator [Lentzea tibetensis]TWP50698.1 hypothetical protein FKR81_19000 [Lentzea tibetensis]